ncbi:LegC family aminotransferase [Lentimicrobium sp. S6]|uniref:LegC family aminotransferase n=1 Tax=Lentimicrobium sp. S6 TaxID=2735872 RepID=UPI0015533886|nr:LegC family aminotransferase [Lentimicrobium sp. S6]NPD46746.1 LegC family aminotransferase [Lentimicrobium sp. S6]
MKKTLNYIRKIYNDSDGFIPLHAPVFLGNEKKYLNECIDSTFVSSVGKFVNQFEQMTSEYVGSKYAIAAANGTAALQIALILAGVKNGDEVVTQALTFVATANAIKHSQANPIFVDVDRDTLGMSPERLKDWLQENAVINSKGEAINKTSKKKISAIVPMHTFGLPCRINEIVDIANEYRIPVVEDSAESLGSFVNAKHTGTFGLLGVFSYNGNKTITTGGGGMIVTDNEELAKRAKHITTTAKIPHPFEYDHDEIGYNYRLTNLAAAMGVAQMENLNQIIENKRKTASLYINYFVETANHFFQEQNGSKSNYWLNSISFSEPSQRDDFLKFSNDNGIMTRPIWKLMNKLEMFKKCQCGDLSNSEWLEARVVNLPSSYNKFL